MRYFRRHWDESPGGDKSHWGTSWWYFEVDDNGWIQRQVESYENGVRLKYDQQHVGDAFGGLGAGPIDLNDFAAFEITETEFAAAWQHPPLHPS